MSWIVYFLEALFFGLFLGYFLLLIENKFNQEKIKRWGGGIIIVGSLLVITINPEIKISFQILSFLIGGLAILFFGFWDDFKKLSWRWQLLFQVILAFFLICFGFSIEHIKLFNELTLNLNIFEFNLFGVQLYLIAIGAFSIWLIMVINAINWIDGIDGLAGIVSIMAFLSIFFVSLRPEVNQPAIAIISLILIGATLAFLFFNFSSFNLMAGTSGSYFLGFALAILAVIAGVKIATLMIIIVLPLIDAILVIFDRIKNKKSIFVGDKKARHLHYRLLNIGWTEKKIVFFYGAFFTFILLVNLYLQNRNAKLFFLFLEIIVIVLFISYVYKKDLNKKYD